MKNLINQISYDGWANSRYFDVLSMFDQRTLDQTITSSFPSIHETLVHILWAEELWFERWQGRSFVKSLNLADYPTASLIRTKLEDVHQKQLTLLRGMDPASADLAVSYVNFRDQRWEYSLRQMVQHLVFHSAYHRGQLATMLRQLGK